MVLPSNATNKTLTYKSDNQNVLKILDNGTIYAVGAGSANITCVASNGVFASCEITVTVPVESLHIAVEKRRYKIGDIARFRVEISPDDATDKRYMVSVTGTGGEYTEEYPNAIFCDSPGIMTITATALNGVSDERSIEIIDLDEFASEVLRLTNIERQKAGVSELLSTDELKKTASIRAKEIIEFISHDRPDGRSGETVYRENNVKYKIAGENIAAGPRTPEEVVNAWMDSPGHRANILKPAFNYLGVGIEMDPTGWLYWTQNFTD